MSETETQGEPAGETGARPDSSPTSYVSLRQLQLHTDILGLLILASVSS